MVGRQPLVWSPLLRHAFGRRVGRQGDPRVTGFLPHRNLGAGKLGSAKLPMATATYPGKPSPSQYTVEPQVGQK